MLSTLGDLYLSTYEEMTADAQEDALLRFMQQSFWALQVGPTGDIEIIVKSCKLA